MTLREKLHLSFSLWKACLVRKPSVIRYYFHWINCIEAGRSPAEDKIPWMGYEAIQWLKDHLSSKMRVFEWGTGGSTFFFASLVHSVISVEHDSEWYAVVSRHLEESKINNVTIHLREPENDALSFQEYGSTDMRYAGLSFRHYVEVIDKYPDNSFDLVVIDGRARSACMRHATDKIRTRGYLLLDDSHRKIYKAGTKGCATWQRYDFMGPCPYKKAESSTTLWQKPV